MTHLTPSSTRVTTSRLAALLAFGLAAACSKPPAAVPAATGAVPSSEAAGAVPTASATSAAATASPTTPATPDGPLPDRDPALAHELVAKGALLLDVRTPKEFGEKHLDGALNVPVDDLPGRLAEIEKLSAGDKQKPIVVYCKSGGRAGRAKAALLEAGFGRVTNLGGIDDWDRAPD